MCQCCQSKLEDDEKVGKKIACRECTFENDPDREECECCEKPLHDGKEDVKINQPPRFLLGQN